MDAKQKISAAIIIDRGKVLLIKRNNEPYKDTWALPGGFMDMNETLLECVVRELKEETGIDLLKDTGKWIPDIGTLGIRDKVDRDPRGRIISHVFICVTNKCDYIVKAGDDAKNAKFMDVFKDLKKIK